MASRETQIDRLQAGILRAQENGRRWGECVGTCAAIQHFGRELGVELVAAPGRALVADLVRRFGADYVRPHLETYGLLAWAATAPGLVDLATVLPDANSPEGVGAKGDPGGWTGGPTRGPGQGDPFDTDEGP